MPCLLLCHKMFLFTYQCVPTMSRQGKKKKVDFERYTFKEEWKVINFVTQVDGKASCLLCSDTVAMLK